MERRTCFALVAFVFALSFTGCDSFFSTSWGKSREYDATKIDVNAGNIDQWLSASVGNPALAGVISDKIYQQLQDDNLGAADKAVLLTAGVNLAVESSGLGQSILSNAAGALGNLGNMDDSDLETTVTTILTNIWNDFTSGGGSQAADTIAKLAALGLTTDADGNPITTGAVEFNQSYKDAAQPGDVAEAVLVLVLGELGDLIDKNPEEWTVADWDTILNEDAGLPVGLTDPADGPQKVTVNAGASDKEIALAAYLNLIVEGGDQYNGNPLTNTIRDALFNINTNS